MSSFLLSKRSTKQPQKIRPGENIIFGGQHFVHKDPFNIFALITRNWQTRLILNFCQCFTICYLSTQILKWRLPVELRRVLQPPLWFCRKKLRRLLCSHYAFRWDFKISRLVRISLLINAITKSFFSGKFIYKSNRKRFSYIRIAWYKHSSGWENSPRLCKPSTLLRVCITVSKSPNPSRVYIRLWKHGKRFLLLFKIITTWTSYCDVMQLKDMTGSGIGRWKHSAWSWGWRENFGRDGGIEEPYWGPSSYARATTLPREQICLSNKDFGLPVVYFPQLHARLVKVSIWRLPWITCPWALHCCEGPCD